MDDNICIFSYNSRGFNSIKQNIVQTLLSTAGKSMSIICNQEFFLLKSNEYIIKKCLPNHHILFKPATKKGLNGRPKNGMFIAVPECLKESVKEVSSLSPRIQSALIEMQHCKIMLINTYFPQDPRCDDFDETDVTLTLSELRTLINNNDFDQLIWTGDINADFKRKTRYVEIIKNFIREMKICKSWDTYKIDFTHESQVNGVTHTSAIDHFFWNPGLSDSIIDAGVLHLCDNFSDHSPVFCKLKNNGTAKRTTSNCSVNIKSFPNWKRSTDTQKLSYFNELGNKLKNLKIPTCVTDCYDLHCKNEMHRSATDDLMLDILSSIETSTNNNIHTPKKNKTDNFNTSIPNWKSEIKPFKENAQFWHSIWLSAGRPLNCQLHIIMKRTRNIYHLHVRKSKRLLDRIKKDNMLNACLQNKLNIFDEIRQQRKCKQTFATSIDGCTNNIPSHFAKSYKGLYNNVNDKDNLSIIENKLESNINNNNSHKDIGLITCDTLKIAAQRIKPGKSDPLFRLTSDCFLYAPDILYELLSILLKSYLTHAHVSEFLLLSTLIPIVKDKLGDITNSNNYRSIAINSIVMKIFDWVIISEFNNHLQLHDLQFSYQSNVSTSMCTWMAVETISYFLRNGSEVYTCMMDMSKAFDTVKHSVLFETLLEQGMPCIIVRYLLICYQMQQANVKWRNEFSDFFKIGNGVKQGAVLSAVLYCVYTNGLFEELQRLKIGCCIGQNYIGIIGYADDLFLMAPSIDGLQKMLKVCERYAESHNLCFSTNPNPTKSKTKCMAFLRKEREIPKLMLCGNYLPWVNTGKHLGTRLNNNPDNILSQDITEKRARYIQRNNELMQEFSYCHCSTKAKINAIFNIDFYGAVLWDLFGREAGMIYNTWNTSIRKMFRLDRRCHRYFIEPISKLPHIKIALLKRFIRFTEKLSCSSKISTRILFNSIKDDCRCITGHNLRKTMQYCSRSRLCKMTANDLAAKKYYPIPNKEIWRVNLVQELLMIRDGDSDVIRWNKLDVSNTIEYLCIT